MGALAVLTAGVLALVVAPSSMLMVITGCAMVAYSSACIAYRWAHRDGRR